MKTSKKIAALFLCVALCASLMSGCGKTKKTEKKADAINYDKAVTLADYKKISLKKTDIDTQLQSQITQLLDQNKTYEPIKKGKVADGDTVNIFYVGKVDGKEFEGGSLTKESNPDGYNLTIGSKQFIDGFEDALIGKKIGSTSDIQVQFPEDYSVNSDLAGKPAVFTVTINYKQGKAIVPEFTDDFVKSNIPEYETAEAYKAELRQGVIQNMAWEKVMDEATINDYPKQLIKDNTTRLETALNTYLEQSGSNLEDYIASQNMTMDSYEAQKQQTAKDATGEDVVCNAIAKKEKITVSDEEYQAELKKMLDSTGNTDEKELDKTFKTYYGFSAKQIITKDKLRMKVEEYLMKNVVEE